MFAAFNVSARNIYDFLFADDSRNVGLNSFKSHYGTYQPNGKSSIAGTLDKLHRQVFHLGKARTKEPGAKVNLDRIGEVFKWADENMVCLIANLDFKDSSDLAKIDVDTWRPLLTLGAATLVSATNITSGVGTTLIRPKAEK